MRAVQFEDHGPAQVLQVVDVPEPDPGPGQVRVVVRASGVSPGEVRLRSGELRGAVEVTFPVRTGFDAAGVVDRVGEGVTDLEVGDEVFGMADLTTRGSNADLALLVAWAPKPPTWTWQEAGGAAGGAETATRVLDRLALVPGSRLLVHGAAGGTGVFLVQMAVARGLRVVGTASEHNHDLLRSLGAEPTTYGVGLVDRVEALAPDGVEAAVDCAGGALADLVRMTGGDPSRVVTIADFSAADHGVHFTIGGVDPVATHGLAAAVELAAQGRLRVPLAATFRLADVVAAHELSETRHANGKIVLVP